MQRTLTLILLLAGCNRAAGQGTNARRADCDTLEYEARSLSARVTVPNRASVELDTSKQALREVDEWVEKYFASWSTVCRDYKNGTLTREEYRDETGRIRRAMERFEELALQVEKAASPAEFDQALRATWTAVAPTEEHVDLQLELRVMAKRPGESAFAVAPPGATLPTGTEVYALVKLAATANVQFYQTNARAETTVLFPDPQITLTNPLPADQELRLPPNGVFVLDDKDLGIEDLHVLATSDAIAAAPAGGGGEADCGERGLVFKADTCPETRGLVFEPRPGEYSLKAANVAAQRGVHVVYTFHHVGDPASYGKKCPGDPDDDCRGIEPIQSAVARRPPAMPESFASCPGNAAVKEMPGAEGSYERWCVEVDAQHQLVDHGPYRKWYGNGRLWVKGQLDMGRRTGTWATYDANGKRVAEIGY
ncbi:MAG TPA: hypothetical protein VG755_13390 [Nannocystaceae bacterium]|nr:hypothetical protein [Nannocystaceae bacterium]